MQIILFAVVLIIALVYAAFPRRPDLTAFDPDFMGQLECVTWRYYYERKYFKLLLAVYRGIRHLRFSPANSARIAWNAGLATRLFQSSTSRQEAGAALPALVQYFTGLLPGAPVPFSTQEAARAELEWWQARREGVPPEQYGLRIAHVAKFVYGVDTEEVKQAGILRARAMSYRDQRKLVITKADWSTIEQILKASYALLKGSVSPPKQSRFPASV
jgi:hypothetical protein